MKTKIQFIGFDGYSHHHEFVNELVTSSLEKFERQKEFEVDVICRKITSKFNHHKEFYECELKFFGDYYRPETFTKKSGHDLPSAVKSTLMACEKFLRRESRTRRSRERKLYNKTQTFIDSQTA